MNFRPNRLIKNLVFSSKIGGKDLLPLSPSPPHAHSVLCGYENKMGIHIEVQNHGQNFNLQSCSHNHLYIGENHDMKENIAK